MHILKIIDILQSSNLLLSHNITKNFIISHISFDSRDIISDTLFFCKGRNFSESFLSQAQKNGAICYISETLYSVNLPSILVNDIRKSMALIANAFYFNDIYSLKTTAITGTKGKTTTAHFIRNILDEHVCTNTSIISSCEISCGDIHEKSTLTTPESLDLHRYISRAKLFKNEFLTLEISSQAYKTDRVFGLDFNYGIFLNISPDHIGELEHLDFDEYFNCKLKLFDHVQSMILPKDDIYFDTLRIKCDKNNIKYTTFGVSKCADFYCENMKATPHGSSFTVINNKLGYKHSFSINIPGDFNILNALCAIAHAKNLGISDENIQRGLSKTKIPGRMEIFATKNTTVIVDYAHNFISYQCLFRSLKKQFPNKKIVVVGGCPGNKAYNRRIDFANALSLYADFAYITTDDPAFEDFRDISADITSNFSSNFHYSIIEDRTLAIETAHSNCDSSTILVIVGKGADCYQRVFGNLVPYESDTKIVRRLI